VLSLLTPVVLLDPEPTCPSKDPTPLLKVVNFYFQTPPQARARAEYDEHWEERRERRSKLWEM
jgi:hypothetical protein